MRPPEAVAGKTAWSWGRTLDAYPSPIREAVFAYIPRPKCAVSRRIACEPRPSPPCSSPAGARAARPASTSPPGRATFGRPRMDRIASEPPSAAPALQAPTVPKGTWVLHIGDSFVHASLQQNLRPRFEADANHVRRGRDDGDVHDELGQRPEARPVAGQAPVARSGDAGRERGRHARPRGARGGRRAARPQDRRRVHVVRLDHAAACGKPTAASCR